MADSGGIGKTEERPDGGRDLAFQQKLHPLRELFPQRRCQYLEDFTLMRGAALLRPGRLGGGRGVSCGFRRFAMRAAGSARRSRGCRRNSGRAAHHKQRKCQYRGQAERLQGGRIRPYPPSQGHEIRPARPRPVHTLDILHRPVRFCGRQEERRFGRATST